MTHPHPLEALLERTADRVPVGPAPSDRLAREAARARRGRFASLAGAAAVLVVAGGLTGIASLDGEDPDPTRPPAPTSAPDPVPVPEGTRLVGLGSAAIAVPEDWGTNDTRCGTPQADTVVIDVTGVDLCLEPRLADVDSVEVTTGRARFDFRADRTLTVGGEPAQRQDTRCSEGFAGVPVCDGTLRFPQLGISFRAESSTDAATVDGLLGGVRVLDGQVGVPGYMPIFDRAQERSGEQYAARLRRDGFVVRTTVVESGLPAGFVEGAIPRPGTVVPAGSEVVVRVSDGP